MRTHAHTASHTAIIATTQRYEAHRDFFNPNDYLNQPGVLGSVDYGARNRLATVFWYMTTVEGGGGETYFPRALNNKGAEYKKWNGDFSDCYRGLSVKAVEGNAIIFYSMLPNGALDERSMHGGCPPSDEKAVKWAANKWIWSHPNTFRETYPLKQTGARSNSKHQPASTTTTTTNNNNNGGGGGGGGGCLDGNDACEHWASLGECKKNPAYMESTCRLSCGVCKKDRTEL